MRLLNDKLKNPSLCPNGNPSYAVTSNAEEAEVDSSMKTYKTF